MLSSLSSPLCPLCSGSDCPWMSGCPRVHFRSRVSLEMLRNPTPFSFENKDS